MAFESVKDEVGQCIFASHPKEDQKIRLEPHAFHRGKQIRGSWGGAVVSRIVIFLLSSICINRGNCLI